MSVHAASHSIADLFGNSGFENGNLTGWTVTQPNSTYVASTTVNPSINSLTAPVGSYFVGVANPGDVAPDEKRKPVHTPVIDITGLGVVEGDTIDGILWAIAAARTASPQQTAVRR